VRRVVSFSLTGGRNWTIKTSTLKYFTYSWHSRNTVTLHVPLLISVDFMLFIMSECTTNAKRIFNLNECTHEHLWPWSVAPFQLSLHCGEGFDRHKIVLMKCFLQFVLAVDPKIRSEPRPCPLGFMDIFYAMDTLNFAYVLK